MGISTINGSYGSLPESLIGGNVDIYNNVKNHPWLGMVTKPTIYGDWWMVYEIVIPLLYLPLWKIW